jgi:tetratricopeptide (TPR) repeat protein
MSVTLANRNRPARSATWLKNGGFALFIAAAVFLAYRPAWHGGFLWDDDVYVVHNELLTAPDGLQRIWFSADAPSQYFPLTYTTLRIERALWGLDTTGYHLVNIALHVLNAWLVWLLLARLRLRLPGAAIAAAVFALHPVQVESVAWITERKNVLMGAFFLLTLIAWRAFAESETRRRWWFYAAALLCYALALFSKTTACTIPAALLLILWLRRKPINRGALAAILPFVVLGLAMGVVTIAWERYHQGTRGQLFSLGIVERVLIASRAIWFYIGELLWPANLTFSDPRWQIDAQDPVAYTWLLAGLAIAGLIAFVRRFVGRGPEVAALFFVATLAPTLGFVMLYTFRYTFVADHYQYLACIAPVALVCGAAGFAAERSRTWRYSWFVLSAALIACLAVLTSQQSAMYRDLETLWRTTITRNPSSLMAHLNLGELLMRSGRRDEAITEFNRALAADPESGEAHYNLAGALLEKGDIAGALEQSGRAVALWPDNPAVQSLRGFALVNAGQAGEALSHYRAAVELKPDDAKAHYDFASALLRVGRLNEALEQLRPALASGQFPEAHAALGSILWSKGQFREALAEFSTHLALAPADTAAKNNLAWLLATCPDASLRDPQKALQFAQEANDATHGADLNVVRTLAAAYADTGEFAEATHAAEVAIEMARERGQAGLAEQIATELRVYQSASPFPVTAP